MNVPHKKFLSAVRHSLPAILLACACSAPPEPETTATKSAAPPKKKQEPEWVAGPSPQEIKQVVNARGSELRQCYLVGTFKNSQLVGTVTVLFTINTEGKVSRASDAGSDIGDPEVITCVLGVFGDLEFAPGGSTDTEVEYPVVFGQHG